MPDQLTVREALVITGGLGRPTKMPCPTWSITQRKCKTGAKQAQRPGTVCSKCYAARSRYTFPVVQQAMQRRLEGLRHPRWVDAMIVLIREESTLHFRWFDSGDLQSADHLAKIVKVAKALPEVQFWLPTQEQLLVKPYLNGSKRVPKNLTIRVTAPMINPRRRPQFPYIAGVIEKAADEWDALTETNSKKRWYCLADRKGEHACGTCRACWDKDIKEITYRRT